MKKSTTYVIVTWLAATEGQPHIYYDEIDEHRWSLRCIRSFPDGSSIAFHSKSYRAKDLMPEAAIPAVKDINADSQFKAKHISKREFEKLWSQVYGLNQHSMLEPIRDVLPEFTEIWDAFVLEWADNPHHKNPAGLPLYLVIAHLAKCLVMLLEQNHASAFQQIFETVEAWLTRGDKYVVDAAGAGLLEDLQNPVNYQRLTPDHFKHWFGPVTLKAWERLKLP